MKEDAQFFVGQKALIEKDGQLLVLNDPIEGLDYPGGKIQEGELDWTKSLQREVREETGLEISIGDPFATGYFEFSTDGGYRNAGKKVFLVFYKCKYVSGEVKLSHEHDSYKWVTKDDFHEADDGTEYFDYLKKYFG